MHLLYIIGLFTSNMAPINLTVELSIRVKPYIIELLVFRVVTIGNGINLGTKDTKYFKQFRVKEEIVKKLDPYFGVEGKKAAKRLLTNRPLKLNKKDAKELSKKVKKKTLKGIRRLYNKAIGKHIILLYYLFIFNCKSISVSI